MKRFLQFMISPLLLGTLGIAALCALAWWIGPLISVGSARPLGSFTARALTVSLVLAAWIVYVSVRLWNRRRRSAMLLKGLGDANAVADQEAQVLQQRFSNALAKLHTGSNAFGKLLGGSDALYALPWYVFIGAPGAGKTTALRHAGLQFVIEEDQKEVRGVGGTRNCDWWFAREAVLIDTAGRYTMQESDRAVDSAGWDKFLALLQRARPRRPINGVLLTVSVPDLLQQNETIRAEHATKLRARLQELQAKLGVRAPVYVLVTKADLIAGFNESFESLGKEDREQVWGFTLPADRLDAANPLRDTSGEFKLLQQRLEAGLLERLRLERDPSRRALMFGFPVEFGALLPLLTDFLERVFGAGGTAQEPIALRGVYFTSGTQEGTPIDRVMGTLSRAFGVDERMSRPPAAHGRSYFLRRLLIDVVFPEAHLVSFNAKAERRRRILRAGGFAATALAAVLLVAGWTLSYMRNTRYTNEVAARVPGLRSAVEAVPISGVDPLPLLPVLDGVSAAAAPADFPLHQPPLLTTLGLYQGEKLDAAAQAAYEKLLQHGLAPRVVQRLEERLRAANRDNLEQAYEALKAYLMVYTPEHFSAESLKAWIAVDWDAQFAQLTPEQRHSMERHLDAMLALGAPPPLVAPDMKLVTSVRDMLASFPLQYRIYSRIQRRYRGELPEFSVAAAAGPNAPKVLERASGEPLSHGVPGLYTREGYAKVFQQGPFAKTAAQLASEESWVLGRSGGPRAGAAALSTDLESSVRRLYLEDYAKRWERLISDVRLVRVGGLESTIDTARILSVPDSPLVNLLRAAAVETTLVPVSKEPSAIGKAAAAVSQAKKDLAALSDPTPASNVGQGPIERIVDDRFAWLHRMVQGQPAPIDDIPKLFGEVYGQLKAVEAAQKAKTAPPSMDASKLKAAAGQQPELVRAMVETLADAGTKQGRAAETGALATELRPLQEFCQRAVANRYPLAAGSRTDVLPEDFAQLFGPGGLMDDFFQRKLAALVDTSTNPWSYKPLPDGTRPPTPAALAEFQRAARIREAFFHSGGRTPASKHEIRALEFSPDVKEVKLDIDGQATTLTPASVVSVTVPSPRPVSQVRLQLGNGQPMLFEGPWAVYRMFDHADILPGAAPERFGMTIKADGKQARFDVIADSVLNPYRLRELHQFRCPGSL